MGSEVQSSIFREVDAQREFHAQQHDAETRGLDELYVVPEDGSVAVFLEGHPWLPQMLVAALPHLRTYFPEPVFALGVSSDEFGWENLYVDILWPGDALEALRLLDQFGDDWWNANSRAAQGVLTFTYRLV